MIKYVINSGGLRHQPEKAAKFFQEVLKGFGESPRILLCFFAAPREDWNKKFPEFSERIAAAAGEGVKPQFTLAFPDKFIEQSKNSDAIILSGGDDYLLQFWLKQYNLIEIWQGKVVATASASSDALARHYWTCDWRQCLDGFGILPIKFIPHYNSAYGEDDPRGPIDWAKAYAELAEYGDRDLPIHALEEGDYLVFEK